MLLGLLLAAALSSAPPVAIGVPEEPTFNLSAIRYIVCDKGSGTGFMVADDIIATAGHVAKLTGCKDAVSGSKLTTYHDDEDHDFALMSGTLPDMPVFKWDCLPYKKNEVYSAYGISSFGFYYPVFRSVSMIAAGKYEDIHYRDGWSSLGISRLDGYIVHGMSGGPIVNIKTGKVVGIVNGGLMDFLDYPVGPAYSFELRKTILCQANPDTLPPS